MLTTSIFPCPQTTRASTQSNTGACPPSNTVTSPPLRRHERLPKASRVPALQATQIPILPKVPHSTATVGKEKKKQRKYKKSNTKMTTKEKGLKPETSFFAFTNFFCHFTSFFVRQVLPLTENASPRPRFHVLFIGFTATSFQIEKVKSKNAKRPKQRKNEKRNCCCTTSASAGLSQCQC